VGLSRQVWHHRLRDFGKVDWRAGAIENWICIFSSLTTGSARRIFTLDSNFTQLSISIYLAMGFKWNFQYFSVWPQPWLCFNIISLSHT
jgi:hypothetical protein